MVAQKRTLRRGECTLAYEISGSGDAVVLLHGFGMSRQALQPLASSLRESGAATRPLLFDARGHGETRTPEDDEAYGYGVMRDDLHALLEREAPQGAHLVGHSMGGQIALMAAISQPERVRSLCLIGAGPCRAVTDEREQRAWQRAAATFETATPDELRAALESAAPTTDASLTPTRLYAEARGQDLARVIRGGFLRVKSNDDACAGVRAPTLIIAGSEDRTWLAPSRQLAELIPNSELLIVAGAGHLVHLEHAHECVSSIGSFIRSH